MRIVILTLPRTGGTNFGKWLATELDYEFMSEPVNYKRQNLANYDLAKDNIVVKYTFDEFKYKIDTAEKILKEFDYVILHYRKTTYDESKSWAYHNFYKREYSNLDWHKNYFIYQNWEEKNKNLILEKEKFIKNKLNLLLTIKSNLITTYEDIFFSDGYKKLENNFNFKSKHLEIINSKNRYFQGNKKYETKIQKTLL